MTLPPGGYADGDTLQVWDREREDDKRFIKHLLDRQARELPIRHYEHMRAISLIDRKKLGMCGFKYCSIDDARRDPVLKFSTGLPV